MMASSARVLSYDTIGFVKVLHDITENSSYIFSPWKRDRQLQAVIRVVLAQSIVVGQARYLFDLQYLYT